MNDDGVMYKYLQIPTSFEKFGTPSSSSSLNSLHLPLQFHFQTYILLVLDSLPGLPLLLEFKPLSWRLGTTLRPSV